MNIRDVVNALTAKADQLPAGWDTEVRVSMCASGSVEITTEIEVDHMTSLNVETHVVNEIYAIVQGHPHVDERVQRLRAATEGADEALQRWADEDNDGDAASE